jgi:NADH-quinone oxidoreductase subunit E
MTDEQRRRVDFVLAANDFRDDRLIQILQEVQAEENHHYLANYTLEYISDRMEIPLSRIYSIASFYGSFSLKQRGTNRIKVCRGTACHLERSELIEDHFRRKLRIREGISTPDLAFSVETINCPGCCWMAPVVIVNEVDYYERIALADVSSILERYERHDTGGRATCEGGHAISAQMAGSSWK